MAYNSHIIKYIFIILGLFLSSVGCRGQKNLIRKADSVIVNKYINPKVDTNYLKRPDKKWTFRVSGNMNYTETKLNTSLDGQEVIADMQAGKKITMSFKIAYSGLSLSLSANPAQLFGKETDWSYNCSSFGRAIGGDILATSTKTMKGNLTFGGTDYTLSAENVKQNSVYATGYYVFNNKRFSYPAAFSQSYIQKLSAGSWILGACIYASDIQAQGVVDDMASTKLKTFNFGIGMGYGYNWVPGKGWLVHLSTIPNFCLYNYAKTTINGESKSLDMQFPEFVLSNKLAVIYNFGNYFIGTTTIFDYYSTGRRNSLLVKNYKVLSRAFFGVRF